MATGDIREIDMTKATNLDGKKIRLVGDDGKGYWIEKEDLAAVVGGLLYMEKSIESDFNEAMQRGLYTSSGNALNRPTEEIVNYNVKVSVFLDVIMQEAYSRTYTIKRYIRRYSNGGWSAWQQM